MLLSTGWLSATLTSRASTLTRTLSPMAPVQPPTQSSAPDWPSPPPLMQPSLSLDRPGSGSRSTTVAWRMAQASSKRARGQSGRAMTSSAAPAISTRPSRSNTRWSARRAASSKEWVT